MFILVQVIILSDLRKLVEFILVSVSGKRYGMVLITKQWNGLWKRLSKIWDGTNY